MPALDNIPAFIKGERLRASQLNALVDRANLVRSGRGEFQSSTLNPARGATPPDQVGAPFSCLILEPLTEAAFNETTGQVTVVEVSAKLYTAGSGLTEDLIEDPITVRWRGEAKDVPEGASLIGMGVIGEFGYEVFTVRCNTKPYNPA